MSSNVYDFTLPAVAGASQLMPVVGSQCLITNLSTYQVQVTTETGEKYKLFEGQGFDFQAVTGRQFSWLLITNLQAVAVSGSIFIGDSGWLDRRMFGNVKVIDQGADKTISGNQFFGGSSNAADAANQCVVALRNTAAGAAAGKRLSVSTIYLSSPTAGDFIFNIGTGTGTACNTGTPYAGHNKLSAGAAPYGVLSGGIAVPSSSLAVGEMPGAVIPGGRIACQAGVVITLNLKTPIILAGTAVLAVLGVVANRQVNASFEWEEV